MAGPPRPRRRRRGVLFAALRARKPRFRLRAAMTADAGDPAEILIPIRWIKLVVAIFLLPVAWVLTQSFFEVFTHATVERGFWATEEFWFFSLGALLWIIAFYGLPRPVLVYVFGHELTHAVWVWMMGGRVTNFRIGRNGGQIVTDTNNFLVALAPYFFPIYSILLVTAYGAGGLFWDLAPYARWFYGLLGVTWAFHFTFTCWVIPKGQSDLADHGTFFSLLVVYLANLLVLAALLVVASHDVTPHSFGEVLLQNAVDFSAAVVGLLRPG